MTCLISSPKTRIAASVGVALVCGSALYFVASGSHALAEGASSVSEVSTTALSAESLPDGDYAGTVSDGTNTYSIAFSVENGSLELEPSDVDDEGRLTCQIGKLVKTEAFEVNFREFAFTGTQTWSTDSGSGNGAAKGKEYLILSGTITNTGQEPMDFRNISASFTINETSYFNAEIEGVPQGDDSWEEELSLEPLQTTQIRLVAYVAITDLIGMNTLDIEMDVPSVDVENSKINHTVLAYSFEY